MSVSIDEQIEAVQQEITETRFNYAKARPKITDPVALSHLKKLQAAVKTLEKVRDE